MIGRDEFHRGPAGASARTGQAAAARQRRPRCADQLDRRHRAQLRRRQGAPRVDRLVHHGARADAVLRRTLVGVLGVPARPGVRCCRALPDARLSPVQPLLHRHPRRARARRRDRGAAPARRVAPSRRERPAGERLPAPSDRAFAARGASPCVRRVLLVRAALDLRPRPCRRGVVPARRVRQPLLGVPQRQRRHRRQRAARRALAAPLPDCSTTCRRA